MTRHRSLPEPDGALIHNRTYDVKAYRVSPSEILLRGTISDVKPPGHYFIDDPDELDVHLMIVDLRVGFPSLEITAAEVAMEVVPHSICRRVEEGYSQLVGLSISRGFSKRVKELFGGPRGCTHVGALLLAMVPVAVQSIWSMKRMAETGAATEGDLDEARETALAYNTNSCHVWAEEGEFTQAIMAGEDVEPPIWVIERLEKLGRPLSDWGE